MVAELDMNDQDVTKIADMIDGEIASLVPEWKPGPGILETPRFANPSFCQNCASNHTSTGSLINLLSKNPGAKNFQILQCLGNGCAATYGRFEEITYQVDNPSYNVLDKGNNLVQQSHSNDLHHLEYWNEHEIHECSSLGSVESDLPEEEEENGDAEIPEDYGKEMGVQKSKSTSSRDYVRSFSNSHTLASIPSFPYELPKDYEHEIQQELRWLRATYQIKLREQNDQQLGVASRTLNSHIISANDKCKIQNGTLSQGTLLRLSDDDFSLHLNQKLQQSSPNSVSQRDAKCEAQKETRIEDMVNAKSFYNSALLPSSLHRTTSLPVDAIYL